MAERETSIADYEATLAAAETAAATLAGTPPAIRADRLRAVAEALDEEADRLVPIALRETQLAEVRLRGELQRTTFQLRLFAEAQEDGSFLQATIDHADPEWPMGARPDLRRTLRPIGPVAVYAASNFPFAFSVAGGDTAAALAAGAPVVVKANPGHPELSLITAGIVRAVLERAGAPAGTFGLVSGFGTGRRLVLDPRISAASFTGSLAGGRALYDLAVNRESPIPFYGELGSTNPAFVTPSADSVRADEISSGFLASMSLGVGQFCTKPGFLFVPEGSVIPATLANLVNDYPAAPMLSDQIRTGYDRTLGTLKNHPSIRVIADDGGNIDAVAPTILSTTAAAVLADPTSLIMECFGPTAIVVTYAGVDELLSAARAFDGQLTGTIVGEDSDEVGADLIAVLEPRVGRLLWNNWPTGVSVTWAMQHGGPYPATTSGGFTSVGTSSIDRFLRPIAYQSTPQHLLPPELRDDNPWSIPQRVDGVLRLPS